MNKTNTKYYILSFLIFLFAAPGVTAYLFYQHPSWMSSSRINKGTLLESPMELASVAGKNKWRLLFWTPTSCGSSCLGQLDKLARVRLALGRKLYQVDQTLILDTAHAQSPSLDRELKDKDFKVSILSSLESKQLKHLAGDPRIFIMNPDNYLILSYQSGVLPGDVYHDLKLLLNTTETRKG